MLFCFLSPVPFLILLILNLIIPKNAVSQTYSVSDPTQKFSLQQEGKSGILIYGQILSHQNFPEVELELVPDPIDLVSKNPKQITLKADTRIGNVWDGANGEYIFSFQLEDLPHNGFLSLRAGENTLLSNYLYNSGDSLKIRFDLNTGTTVFSGPSAPFYDAQYLMKREKAKFELSQPIVFDTDDKEKFLSNENIAQTVKESTNAWRKEIKILERTTEQKNNELLHGLNHQSDPRWKILYGYKDQLEPNSYQKLQTWLEGNYKKDAAFAVYIQIITLKSKNKTSELNSFLTEASKIIKSKLEEIPPIKFVQGNDPYIEYLYYAARIIAESEGKEWHYSILQDLPPLYADLALAKHLVRQKDLDRSFIADWLSQIQNEKIRTFANDHLNSSNLGKIIADAKFQNTNLDTVNLHDFLGKWTLIDFWYTGCSACIKYFENSLSPLEKALSNNPDFQIISISSDRAPERWLQSIEKGSYTSSHAINLYTAGKGHHHPWLKENNIFAYPSQILLSPEGIVVKNTGLDLPADSLLELILTHINNTDNINPNFN